MSAILGGYVVASCAGILLSYLIPASRSDAVLISLLLSFVLYTMAIMWTFAVKSTTKACLSTWGAALSLALLCWALQGTAASA